MDSERLQLNRSSKPPAPLSQGPARPGLPPSEERANESMFTKNFSHSLYYTKQRKKPLKWAEQDTTNFFRCLEAFGTDFSMFKAVLGHKTQRQIVRKFHKERKRNLALVEEALQLHEMGKIQKNEKAYSFLENLFIQTSDSDFFSENNSDVSLEDAVNQKLLHLADPRYTAPWELAEEPIMPLEYYLEEE